ncbi:unnamed protein product, partial [Ectocarpus sp. 12 AP-2014]
PANADHAPDPACSSSNSRPCRPPDTSVEPSGLHARHAAGVAGDVVGRRWAAIVSGRERERNSLLVVVAVVVLLGSAPLVLRRLVLVLGRVREDRRGPCARSWRCEL